MAKLLDKAAEMFGEVKGIFNSTEPPKPNDEEINTPDQQKLYQMAEYDYNVFRSKRQPFEDIWRKEQQMWVGDHWKGLRAPDNGPYPERMEYVGNYAWSQIESVVARLTGWVPTPDFEATEPGDDEKAALLNVFMPWELNRIKFKQKHIRAVRRMVIHGTLLYKVIYDPTVEGGRGINRYNGQNDIIPLNFGSFFPDPAIKDFIDMQKGRAHIINNLLTLDYIRQRWPEQGVKVMADNKSSDTEIFDIDGETITGTSKNNEDNRTTVNVLEYWYKGTPKYMSTEDQQLFKELAASNLAEGKDPLEAEQKSKGQAKGIHCLYVTTNGVFLEHKSYVYDHGQYPIVARTLFPEENNPWGKGYMRDMIAPQTFYNRFVELAIEVTAKMGNSAIIYGTGASITEAFKTIWKRFRSKPGAMLPVQGDVNQVKELQGVPPNPGIYQYIQHFLEMMQKIPGMFDSANGASNPNVTSGRQSEALISAAQGRLSNSAELIEDAVQEVIEQYIELCAQFYSTERVARITGKDVSFSREAIVSQAPTNYDTGEVMVNPMTGEETPQEIPVIEEYVPQFDVKVNIGVEKPRDREYYIQTAFNLLKSIDPATGMPMIDAQGVKYTVENGRMEPMSVIEERMNVAQQQMMQMQQLQQTVEQLTAELQASQEQLGATVDVAAEAQLRDQTGMVEAEKAQRDEVMKQSDTEHKRNMDMQKMDLERQKVALMGQRNQM
jgi:hypothetical protein